MSLVQMLLVSLLVNGFFFIIAVSARTDVFTDITYSLSFAILATILFLSSPDRNAARILTLAAIIVWAVRLGGYLLYRILRIKVDHRFDDRRDSFVQFGSFWLLQAISVCVILLPAYGILSSAKSGSVSGAALVPGSLVFLAGFILEAVADAQKYAFKSKPESKGLFMARGLWKYSRHPNYFGEMLVWWGIAIPGIVLFRGLSLLYFAGPVFITLLLLFVSGIPVLEREANRKWGGMAEYREYRRRTSILVPLPRGKK